MSNRRWSRHDDEQIAVDELLDAAGRAFAELGVARASMVDIASYAGCARATLYRYFANQRELHFAFVHRATLRIAQRMAAARLGSPEGDAARALAHRILTGIDAVRSDPMLAVWFEPENMAVPLRVSQESEVLQAGAAAAIEQLGPDLPEDELRRRGAWLMRTIVSFLALPGVDEAWERAAIEAYVVPVLLAQAGPDGAEIDNRTEKGSNP